MKTAKIAEIFDSVQGEGIYAGVRQVFVRFFGCNLKCAFCDTPLDAFLEKTPDEVQNEILKYGNFHTISLTGGEPLCQADFLKDLLPGIRALGHKIYLETNGTLPQELEKIIDDVDIIAMDIKLPSSTKGVPLWAEHEDFLKAALKKEVFVKMVVTSETEPEDILRARTIIRKANSRIPVILQPNWSDGCTTLLDKMLSFKREFILYGIHDVRILPQAHKAAGIK
ncbi:MAG: 7-carboxy-7-deazaguanine synthase QueE [Candidatus Omnitrophota bacterium]